MNLTVIFLEENNIVAVCIVHPYRINDLELGLQYYHVQRNGAVPH